jgi:hypothetical protein
VHPAHPTPPNASSSSSAQQQQVQYKPILVELGSECGATTPLPAGRCSRRQAPAEGDHSGFPPTPSERHHSPASSAPAPTPTSRQPYTPASAPRQQTPTPQPYATQSGSSVTPRTPRSRRGQVQLRPGFAWDAASLGLLYQWETLSKKGTDVIAERGVFPGHDGASLDAAWAQHKVAAKRHYEDAKDEN